MAEMMQVQSLKPFCVNFMLLLATLTHGAASNLKFESGATPNSRFESGYAPISRRHAHARWRDEGRPPRGQVPPLRQNGTLRNFIMRNTLEDGERETRVHYNGAFAKEITVGANRSDELIYRQIANDDHIITLFYGSADDLADCEYVDDRRTTQHFTRGLKRDANRARRQTNLEGHRPSDSDERTTYRGLTLEVLEPGARLPRGVESWMNYPTLEANCSRRHREILNSIENSVPDIEDGSLPEKSSRARRSLREVFIAPGTKWCGAGQLARRYSELGEQKEEDRCCRMHDYCPFGVPAFTVKYGLMNRRPFTLTHCRCDKRFRACLKLADTGVANMVGRLFFNVIQTKCFVLKPVKVCVKRSWWGKCLKKGYAKQAHLRDNLPY